MYQWKVWDFIAMYTYGSDQNREWGAGQPTDIHFILSVQNGGFSCRISSVDGTDEFFEGETIVRAC
jgi:hypothetical protein